MKTNSVSKHTADALYKQHEWLRVTLASIGDAVITTDTKGCVTFLNPAAQSLTGWTPEEAAGVPLDHVFKIVNEETHRTVENPVTRTLREGVIVGLANHTLLIAKDGTERPIDDSAAPIRNGSGEVAGTVLVFRDITERRRLERQTQEQAEALADLHERKDEFLAMLSHELRNPLSAIFNALHILRLQDSENFLQQKAKAVLERQVGQLAHLVDDLLEVSRVITGRIQLREERLDLRRIVERAIESARPLMDQHKHTLAVSCATAPLWLRADPTRLEQIIVNLLNNAIKYTEEGGQVWLIAQQEGNEIVLRVRDTGVGIAPQLLSRIFDLFTQADQTLDRSQGGLGIGLSLVHQLVQLHGGTVEAHSAGLGHGSEFIVRLPAISPATESSAPTDIARQPAPPLRVLIVEDNRDAADMFVLMLRTFGYEAQAAYSGQTALDMASQFHPDFVLLDIGLPKMDGYEVARRLRQHPQTKDVWIIALTGYGQDSDRQRTHEAGFNYHLVKPVDPRKLRELLTSLAK